MTTLYKFLRSLDLFGARFNLNYRGDGAYKTGIGALVTLMIRAFMFFYVMQCALRVLDY